MFLETLKPFLWIDYGIIALIAVTLSIGAIRGFSREIIVLLCWVIGFLVSLHFSATVSTILQGFVFAPIKRFVMTFVGLLVLTILVSSLFQQWFKNHVKQTYNHTVFMEHFGGLLCGIMQGVVITTIVVFLAIF